MIIIFKNISWVYCNDKCGCKVFAVNIKQNTLIDWSVTKQISLFFL